MCSGWGRALILTSNRKWTHIGKTERESRPRLPPLEEIFSGEWQAYFQVSTACYNRDVLSGSETQMPGAGLNWCRTQQFLSFSNLLLFINPMSIDPNPIDLQAAEAKYLDQYWLCFPFWAPEPLICQVHPAAIETMSTSKMWRWGGTGLAR